jgi:hypothetical protein
MTDVGSTEPISFTREKLLKSVKRSLDEGHFAEADLLLQTLIPRGGPRFTFADLGDLSVEPPKRKWLASDRRNGAKVLLMGKAFVLASDGGVGKSYLLLMFAVCVALQIDLFGVFRIESAGHVALFMGEDDLLGCQHRLFKIANALGLDRTQRQLISERVHVCPLAGIESSLLATDPAGNGV